MSEICLDCLNKLTGKNETEQDYVISEELDICEECGKMKQVVICAKGGFFPFAYKFFLLPFQLIYCTACALWWLLCLPYKICKKYKSPRS